MRATFSPARIAAAAAAGLVIASVGYGSAANAVPGGGRQSAPIAANG